MIAVDAIDVWVGGSRERSVWVDNGVIALDDVGILVVLRVVRLC